MVSIGHVGKVNEVPEQLSLYRLIPLGMELNSIPSHVLVLLNGLRQTNFLDNSFDGCSC